MATKLYSEMTPEEQRKIDAQENDRESYKEFLNGTCIRCDGHLGAQNPNKVCDTCRYIP